VDCQTDLTEAMDGNRFCLYLTIASMTPSPYSHAAACGEGEGRVALGNFSK